MSKKLMLKSNSIVTPGGIAKGFLLIEGGRIKGILDRLHTITEASKVMDFSQNILVPGFVDLHIHGAGGYDVMGGEDEVYALGEYLAKNGTTSFYPTTITIQKEELLTSIQGIRNAIRNQKKKTGAEIMGIHLEGPFLSLEKRGAMAPDYLLTYTKETMQELETSCGKYLHRMTLAPEMKGALELIGYLKKRGCLIAGGHTAATYEETLAGISSGITIANHMFNGMKGFHHREPGAVGAYLMNDKITCEIIGDLTHIHPIVLKFLIDYKGLWKTYLVSDAIIAAGLPAGSYPFAGETITVGEDRISRLSDGTIAGSTSLLKDAFRNMIVRLNLSIEEAVYLTAGTPALVAGINSRKGSLEEGKDADIVVLDMNYQIQATFVKGRIFKS